MAPRNRWHTKIPTAADAARKAKYNSPEHKAARKQLGLLVATGTATCWRCGELITGAWHVGHDDGEVNVIRGPEHPDCNRRAGARKGWLVQRANAEAAAFVRPCR